MPLELRGRIFGRYTVGVRVDEACGEQERPVPEPFEQHDRVVDGLDDDPGPCRLRVVW